MIKAVITDDNNESIIQVFAPKEKKKKRTM